MPPAWAVESTTLPSLTLKPAFSIFSFACVGPMPVTSGMLRRSPLRTFLPGLVKVRFFMSADAEFMTSFQIGAAIVPPKTWS